MCVCVRVGGQLPLPSPYLSNIYVEGKYVDKYNKNKKTLLIKNYKLLKD